MKNKLLSLFLLFITLAAVLYFAPSNWKKQALHILSPRQAEKAEVIEELQEINDTLAGRIDEFESVTYSNPPEVNP